MKTVMMKMIGEDDYFTQEAYKTLRTNLQFCGKEIQVIAVTSCMENEGKSTVAMHIARSFSELGKRVILIDADMRKSVMVGRNSDRQNVKGLSEVLSGQEKLTECVLATQYSDMHVLFAGKYPPNPVELLNGNYFKNLLAKLREIYDYIIIDTPPLGIVVDAAVITTQCDGAVIVMSEQRIRLQVAKDVIDKIQRSGCKVLGIVKNNIKAKNRIRYGKDKYYYYKN